MQSIAKMLKMQLIIPLLILPMMTACSSLTKATPTWPEKLEAIELSDGGVCFSKESVMRLNDFKLQLEAL